MIRAVSTLLDEPVNGRGATTIRRNYPQLDTMRAVGAIGVVGTHTSFWAGVYGAGLIGAATQRLEVGVAIFFVLSGFLLGRPFLQTMMTGERHDSTPRYFWKRALRILPVYVVCVVAALLLITENHGLGPIRWLQNLTLTDLYFSSSLPQGLTQMWSLTTEVGFYLALPLLMAFAFIFVCRRRWQPARIIAFLAALYAANIAWIAYVTNAGRDIGTWAGRSPMSYIGWFALGMTLAVVTLDQNRGQLRMTAKVVAIARDRMACWFAAAILFILSTTPIAGSPFLVVLQPSEAITRNLLYGAIAFLLILPCVLGPEDTATARAMSHPVLRHLGHISYSLFCCHVIVLDLMSKAFGFDLFRTNPYLLFGAVLGTSLVVSEILYRVVELPFLRLKAWRSDPAVKATTPSEKATQI